MNKTALQIILDSYLDIEQFTYETCVIRDKLPLDTSEALKVMEKNFDTKEALYGLLQLKLLIETL